MVIDEAKKACLLFEYGSIENFLHLYLSKHYPDDELSNMFEDAFSNITDPDEIIAEGRSSYARYETWDDAKYLKRDEILESMSCTITDKLFNNNQEMIPYLVRALDKLI